MWMFLLFGFLRTTGGLSKYDTGMAIARFAAWNT